MHGGSIRYLDKLYTENGKSCGPADQAAPIKVCAALPKHPSNKPSDGQKKRCHVGSSKKAKGKTREKVGPEGGPSERISIKQAAKADPFVLLSANLSALF
jgi:hypothetical protein